MQKGRIREVAKRGTSLSFGSFGLKALEPVWMTNRQIEAARQALTRAMKREGNVWIRIFPDKPITRKPAEVRMGKGKGNPEFWAAVVEPGRILFEIEGVTLQVAQEAFDLAAAKLPIRTKFIVRRDYVA
jgi:large subunit ribosomal protein L16